MPPGNVLLEQLQPADPRIVNVYQPYYREGTKRNTLPRALSLYQNRSLEGARHIEGGQSIPFVATWTVSMLPADQSNCRMQFDNHGEQLIYEVKIENHVFVDFLIELILNYKRYHTVDFSKGFYRKLLRMDE